MNTFGAEGVKLLADRLGSLSELDISILLSPTIGCNKLGPEEAKLLAPWIQHSAIRTLDLSTITANPRKVPTTWERQVRLFWLRAWPHRKRWHV